MIDEIDPIRTIIGIVIFFIALVGFGVYKLLLQTFYGIITLVVGVLFGVVILYFTIQALREE